MLMNNQNKILIIWDSVLFCYVINAVSFVQVSGKLLSILTSCTGCLTILVDMLDRFFRNLRLLTRLAQVRLHMLLLLLG